MALGECAASGIRPPRTPHAPPRRSSKGRPFMAHAFACVAGACWRDVSLLLRRWAAAAAASTACDAELGLFPAGSAQPPLAPHRRALRTPGSWQGKYMIPETRAGKDRKDRSRAARAPSDSESVGADGLESDLSVRSKSQEGSSRPRRRPVQRRWDSERTCHWRGSCGLPPHGSQQGMAGRPGSAGSAVATCCSPKARAGSETPP
jgi:hypothetical protein